MGNRAYGFKHRFAVECVWFCNGSLGKKTMRTKSNPYSTNSSGQLRGFSLVELITVIAIIAVLIALLLPALSTAKANSEWAASQNNMRQIATLLQGYTVDNRDRVLPSEFDHRPPTPPAPPAITLPFFAGPMRKSDPTPPPIGTARVGTWADILWSTAGMGTFVMPGPAGTDENNPYSYKYDSPDRLVYEAHSGYSKNILRSTVGMKKPFSSSSQTDEATPWGTGASNRELDHPGYFAANNFFTAAPWLGTGGAGLPTSGQLPRYYPSSQIRNPSSAVYLVDSRAGEVINPLAAPWQGTPTPVATGSPIIDLCEVDFRYPGDSCNFLCMDGHVQTEARWDKIQDLQGPYFTSPADPPTPGTNDPDPRGLKISNLDRSDNPPPAP